MIHFKDIDLKLKITCPWCGHVEYVDTHSAENRVKSHIEKNHQDKLLESIKNGAKPNG